MKTLAAKGIMQTTEVAKVQLRLELNVREGAPWPGLRIAADLADLSHVDPLDPLDTLLLRTLLQQPRVGNEFVIGLREFAGVLALLRNPSPNCIVHEDKRVAAIEVLAEAPELEVRISRFLIPAPLSAVGEGLGETVVRASVPARTVNSTNTGVRAGTEARTTAGSVVGVQAAYADIRHAFRCPESGASLGSPLYRGAHFWTFPRAIAPAPTPPSDPRLRAIFDADPQNMRRLTGEDALETVFRARQAARLGECTLRADDSQAAAALKLEPLRQRTRVFFNERDQLVVAREWLTPANQVLPRAESVDAGPNPNWILCNGRAYRVPDDCGPQESDRILDGDAIAEFLQTELPALAQQGAEIDPRVRAVRVCNEARPSVQLKPGADDAVQAQWFFEAVVRASVPAQSVDAGDCAGAEARTTFIAPVELLAAAAQGRKYLRRGDAFIRVNREMVMDCQKKLRQAGVAGSDAAELRGEQIPEMLAWVRAARAGETTPWNLYVADAVDGAHQVKDDPAKLRFNLDVEEENDGETWFSLSATFDHSGVGLSEEELRKLVREGKKWFRKNNQWIKVDAEALKKFELSAEAAGIQRCHSGHSKWGRRRRFYYRFRPAARDRVTEIFSLAGTLQHAQRFEAFLAQLRGFEKVQPLAVPAGMALPLRPYQQQGYEWLAFLASYGLNGILADDMGLGKTAQTIALLTRMKEQSGPAPALIVAPTSLLDNWRAEFAKFSPSMTTMIYRGSLSRRDRLRADMANVDVVLGTYATVRNDAQLLAEAPWRYVILDEAHFIKNSAAVTTKAIKTIPARHRLALTGTPIQNRLTELWSLFDFLMPEFLGRQMRFRENYEDPIARLQSGRAETSDEQQDGEDALERLRERIKPFVLRRLKTDVAKDLPPKIENDIFCTLCPEQLALYRGFSDSDEAKTAVKELMEKGAGNAQTAILAALMSLRKICNHTDLMYLPKTGGRLRVPAPLAGYENRSGKLEALGELLEQCREGGHRALIFCQLTSMLDILGHYLKGMGIEYLRLDGETPGAGRQKQVETFNADPRYGAFLISTRAGGNGLNLTGADTVIFYDHDWNPANDQQAQDRAYRIGQEKTVNVYRLICKGTLEEKILRRQELKKLLANSIVQHDESGMKALTREELVGLFTFTDGAEKGKGKEA